MFSFRMIPMPLRNRIILQRLLCEITYSTSQLEIAALREGIRCFRYLITIDVM